MEFNREANSHKNYSRPTYCIFQLKHN